MSGISISVFMLFCFYFFLFLILLFFFIATATPEFYTYLHTLSLHDALPICVFIGPSLATEDLHLNPTGIFVTSSGLDGVRFRTVNVIGAVLLGCTTNAGNGNVTGAIDTYNGAENINVLGCTIRYFTYAGIKIQNSSNINVIGNIVTEGAKPTAANTNASYGIITASGIRSSEIGRATGRGRVCQYGVDLGCRRIIKKKTRDQHITNPMSNKDFNT